MGVGVGLRPTHFSDFSQAQPKSISWFEVISENYMAWKNEPIGKAHQSLLKLRRDLPVLFHGVSLSIGSAEKVNLDYLKKLKELIDILQPALVSDHLCWTGIDGENLHDLLPVPYTDEALKLIVEKIDQVQNFLGRRILIENPSTYLEFSSSQMSEWEFIAELAERADCGLLLDINNVYVSSVNHSYDPKVYLQALPQNRVGQIHLAGHSVLEGLSDRHTRCSGLPRGLGPLPLVL